MQRRRRFLLHVGLLAAALPWPAKAQDTRTYAMELGGLPLELIVAASLPQALAVREANPRMPLVIGTCPGMISNGFARSLEHPGGLYTGMDELPAGLTARRLALLKLAAPRVTRVGVLSTTPGQGGHETQLAEAQREASRLGLSLTVERPTSRAEIESGLERMAADGVNGLLNFQGALSLFNRDLIVRFARAHRIPAMYQSATFTEAGGLMAWSPDQDEQFRIAARYADRILDGARPGDLAIRHPERYYLTVNRRAAGQIGLELPASLLSQADFVL